MIRHLSSWRPFIVGLVAIAAPWCGVPAAFGAEPAEASPVIVELFTSEGCSSCPPADRLLAQIASAQPVEGARVIALEQHVDYWDDLGWKDPFSSRQATERQQAYAHRFRQRGVYTPQMVVDGAAEFVGGHRAEALDAIARAAHRPKARLVLAPAPSGDAGVTRFAIEIDGLAAARIETRATVWLAIVESGLASDISAGENTGLHLGHGGVVRRLDPIGKIEGSRNTRTLTTPGLVLDPSWNPAALRAVVFLQDDGDSRIVAAAEAPLP